MYIFTISRKSWSAQQFSQLHLASVLISEWRCINGKSEQCTTGLTSSFSLKTKCFSFDSIYRIQWHYNRYDSCRAEVIVHESHSRAHGLPKHELKLQLSDTEKLWGKESSGEPPENTKCDWWRNDGEIYTLSTISRRWKFKKKSDVILWVRQFGKCSPCIAVQVKMHLRSLLHFHRVLHFFFFLNYSHLTSHTHTRPSYTFTAHRLTLSLTITKIKLRFEKRHYINYQVIKMYIYRNAATFAPVECRCIDLCPVPNSVHFWGRTGVWVCARLRLFGNVAACSIAEQCAYALHDGTLCVCMHAYRACIFIASSLLKRTLRLMYLFITFIPSFPIVCMRLFYNNKYFYVFVSSS